MLASLKKVLRGAVFCIFQTLQVYLCLEHKRPGISSSLGLSDAQEFIHKVATIDLLQESELRDNEVPHLTGGILSGSSW